MGTPLLFPDESFTNKQIPTMLLPLTHLKAIVTGGSRGIGFAIAQNFAKLGATVYLVARSPEPLHAAATRINTTIQPSTTPTPTPPTDIDRPGPFYQNATESAVRFVGTIRSETSSPPPSFSSVPRFATALVGDVSLEETWDSILSKVECPDILVNAAGVAQTSLLYKTSVEEIDSILNANLRSTILGCRAAGRAMMKRARQSRQMGQLSIINVSSVMATSGQAGAAAYAASKAGILGKQSCHVFRWGLVRYLTCPLQYDF